MYELACERGWRAGQPLAFVRWWHARPEAFSYVPAKASYMGPSINTRKSLLTPCGKKVKMAWPVGFSWRSLAWTASVQCMVRERYSRMR
jgi:hypothetical protein